MFSWVILKIAGVKVKVTGAENLDSKEAYIFISNHQSYFDIPVLMQAVPNNMRFIYKKSLSRIPVFGWGMYLGGYLPINRDNPRDAMRELKHAAGKVKKGLSVVIFPEGTRSPDGTLGEFKRGMFILAEEAKVKLVPVTVIDTYKILPRNKFEIKGGNVRVIFDKPVEYRRDKNLLNEIRDIIEKNAKQQQ
jgi:1-acyl-sn-glycerol-3-phosphate acyltransferase